MTVFVILVCLIVVAAILMCFIVLIQNSKGGGLAAGFASSNQIMGVRKTTDVLEKATWGLAIFMVVVSVISAYALPTAGQQDSVLLQEAQRESQTNPQGIPGFDASFRFHLAMNTLAWGYVIPAIRAYSGLAPVRQHSCRAY